MFQKNHFFTLLGVSAIVCAYVLNYFEKKYVIFMLAWTVLSAVLDLVWLIVKAGVIIFIYLGVLEWRKTKFEFKYTNSLSKIYCVYGVH